MPLTYSGEFFTLSLAQHSLDIEGQAVSLRPKTFALLCALLEGAGEVLSKQQLLDTLWDDVETDEQVLFQSIGEIRKAFGARKVIQTHPRKGYSWITSVVVTNTTLNPTELPQDTSPPKIPSSYFHKRWLALTCVIIASLGLASSVLIRNIKPTYTSEATTTSTLTDQALPIEKTPGRLLVLPIRQSLGSNDYDWIRLGGMDQVIAQLNDKNRVMDTSYVLSLLNHTGTAAQRASDSKATLFHHTGASWIIEAELTGKIQEYALVYTLHQPKHEISGVIFEDNVEQALSELVNIIQTHATLQTTHARNRQSEFRSHLIAEAIDTHARGDVASGISLLQDFVTLEPSSITAKQLLSEWQLNVQQLPQALSTIEAAIQQASPEYNEFARLYFRLSQIHFALGNDAETMDAMATSQRFAMRENDQLYQAYNYAFEGRYYRLAGNYQRALLALEQALTIYQALHCPTGESSVHLQLTELALEEAQRTTAQQHLDQASKLIQRHRIEYIEGWYNYVATQGRLSIQ